jgi:hypothetical protein
MRRSGNRAMHECRCAGPTRGDDDSPLGKPGGGSKEQREGPCEGARFDCLGDQATEACFADRETEREGAHSEGDLGVGEVADRLGLGQPGREVCTRQTLRPGNRETRAWTRPTRRPSQAAGESAKRLTQRAGNRARRAWTRRRCPVGHRRRDHRRENKLIAWATRR